MVEYTYVKLYVRFDHCEATSFATIEDSTAEQDLYNFTFEMQGFRPAFKLALTHGFA